MGEFNLGFDLWEYWICLYGQVIGVGLSVEWCLFVCRRQI